MFILNGERSAMGEPPVDRQAIRDAEKRCQLVRRRRRSTKSGKSDLESAWYRGGFAFAKQVQGQLRRGAELAAAPTDGPSFDLAEPGPDGTSHVACLPADEWGVFGLEINIFWRGLGWYGCKLVGFLDAYCWAPDETGWAYVVESVTEEYGTCRYLYRSSDVYNRLTQQQQADIASRAEARAAVPPPFVPEQLFHVDQHPKKCLCGK
eukprot:4404535-Prymnesium_polylepis.1